MASAVTFTLPLTAADLTLMQYLIAQATPVTTTPPVVTGMLSPDGTVLTSGATGTLVTKDGTWSFGLTGSIVLNGTVAAATPGPAILRMEVANGGGLYVLPGAGPFTNGVTNWYQYLSGVWVAAQFASGNPEPAA